MIFFLLSIFKFITYNKNNKIIFYYATTEWSEIDPKLSYQPVGSLLILTRFVFLWLGHAE